MKALRTLILLLSLVAAVSCNQTLEVTDNGVDIILTVTPSAVEAGGYILDANLVKGDVSQSYTFQYKIDDDGSLSLSKEGAEFPTSSQFRFDMDRVASFAIPDLGPAPSHHIVWSIRCGSGVTLSGDLVFDGRSESHSGEKVDVAFKHNLDSTQVSLVAKLKEGEPESGYSVEYLIDSRDTYVLLDASGAQIESGSGIAFRSGTFECLLPALDEGEHFLYLCFKRNGGKVQEETYAFRVAASSLSRIWFADASGNSIRSLDLWGGNTYDVTVYYKTDGGSSNLSSAQSWDSYSVEYSVGGAKVTPGTSLVTLGSSGLKAADWYTLSLLDASGNVKGGSSAWASGGLTYTLTVIKGGYRGILQGNLQGTLGVIPDMGTEKDANGRYHLYVCEDNRTPDYVTFVYPSVTKGKVTKDKFGAGKSVTGSGVKVDFGAANVKGGRSCTYKGTYPRTLTSKEYSKSASANTVTVEPTCSFAGSRPALGQNSYTFSVGDPFVMSGTSLLKRGVTITTALYSPVSAVLADMEIEHYNTYHDEEGFPYNYVETRDYSAPVQSLDIKSSSYETNKVYKVSFPSSADSGPVGTVTSCKFTGYLLERHDGHDENAYMGVVWY